MPDPVLLSDPHFEFEVGGDAGEIDGEGVCVHESSDGVTAQGSHRFNEGWRVAGFDELQIFPVVEGFLELVDLFAFAGELVGQQGDGAHDGANFLPCEGPLVDIFPLHGVKLVGGVERSELNFVEFVAEGKEVDVHFGDTHGGGDGLLLGTVSDAGESDEITFESSEAEIALFVGVGVLVAGGVVDIYCL